MTGLLTLPLKWKLTYIFIFTVLCGASKGFTKALNAFLKPLQAPQGSMKIKIWVNFLTSSGIGTGKVNTLLKLLTWTRLRPILSFRNQKKLPEVFFKKRVLKNFATFTGTFCNIQHFIEKRLQRRSFFVNNAKFLTTSILKNICERLLLKFVLKISRFISLWKYLSHALTKGKVLHKSLLMISYFYDGDGKF